MFGPLEVEEQRFRLKPMNCPGHILIYRSRPHRYRDLPIRYSEFGTVYRFERSGRLHGLTRVRGFTQDDAHLFCTPEQLQGEFEQTLDEALRLMKAFGFADFEYFLSTREAALRDETDPIAEEAIRSALERYELPYNVDEGGGAFYGPKLDINVHDAIGRKWQLGTVQVDFVLPERFELKYRGSDGADHHAGDDPSRAGRLARALLRHSDRAFRRRFSGLARAGASGRGARSPSISSSTRAPRATSCAPRASASSSTSRTRSSVTRSATGRRRRFRTSSSSARTKPPRERVNVNERGVDEKRPPLALEQFAHELRDRVERKV